MAKGKELFMDYGEFILHYDFNQRTLFRAHRIARDFINANSQGHIDLDAVAHAHGKAIQQYLAARENLTEWNLGHILGIMFRELGLNGDIPKEDIVSSYKLNDHDIRPVEGVVPALAKLSRGRNLHIISNLPHDSLIYELSQYHLRDFFKTITISCEVGYRKPHPAIYQEALRRVGIPPEEAIFASHDRPDVKGARDIGMQAVLTKNVVQLAEVLR